MRPDSLGMFWRDELPVKKETKVALKKTPPEPTWLLPTYLPYLTEAIAFDVPLYNDQELTSASYYLKPEHKEKFVFDIELYSNYFLIAFKSIRTGKIVYIDMQEGEFIDKRKLDWIVNTFTLVGFNSNNFDIPILSMALAGKTLAQMKNATMRIIEWGENYREVLKDFRVKPIKVDHIDLIEIAPLFASLKIYAGRLHAKRMQDLPFNPDIILSQEQIAITRYYCINDLNNTQHLYESLEEQIKLREELGKQYNIDLRSKSDAQIAESIFTNEVSRLNNEKIVRPLIEPGTCYYYKVPSFLKYKTPLLNWALDTISNARFIVADHGSIELPEEMQKLELTINKSTYTLRIGGLHSTEKTVAHIATDKTKLYDCDVVSYYPFIILNQSLYPTHLGVNFLRAFGNVVQARVHAKRNKDMITSNALKIVINGTFGKLGSKYSNLYAPDLLIQVTVTGQLSILMLIERLELKGIEVVSANTDGIVVKCPTELKPLMDAIVKQWEVDTNFEMEFAEYSALYSRDINNYIAVKPDGKVKTKGAYANPWAEANKSVWLSKNPTSSICIQAVQDLLVKRTPIITTITECKDITKFITVRTVKGGAVKDGEYLGKAIRWYYAENETGEIIYAKSGNKVARSDGAKPLMDLPSELPTDINYDWYVIEAEKILKEIGYV
jgi:hypothetical protein